MGRVKKVKDIQKQLQFAESRLAYTAPARQTGTQATQRMKTPHQYQVMSHVGTTVLTYTVRASVHALEFFGDATGTELGLGEPAADGSPPRGFKTAKIHAVKSVGKAEVVTAKPSKRPYLKYTPTGGQSSYSAPITSKEGVTGVVSTVKTIYAAKKEVVGPYGRIYFTPEFYVIHE
ncbi:MAG: hypothetical protein H0X31_00900 [Nostocaceae cyanobacterium]|nr:hypothetical protein [Nostocaceae cyanobacterium]